MTTTATLATDPDRFCAYDGPGAHEWWYFDAVSDCGRDALVVVWYAGLPFDPAYGTAALRHCRRPGRHPAPHPLDHSAIGLSWYRDGQTVAYALNAFRRHAFAHEPSPFRVAVGPNVLARDEDGYRLRVATPERDRKRRIEATLHFAPAPGSRPFEIDLGTPAIPHLWMLAAADCRVEGTVRVGRPGDAPTTLTFRGRGYHDHNAGAEEITRIMRRWHWGRVHDGDETHVYYTARTHHDAPPRSLWITLRDGAPQTVRDALDVAEEPPRLSRLGLRTSDGLAVADPTGRLERRNTHLLDDGPFYRRWLADYALPGRPPRRGISELLDTRHLHHPAFNWMIPFRLKRPAHA
jgi:carotenoid 1,2-hydratase